MGIFKRNKENKNPSFEETKAQAKSFIESLPEHQREMATAAIGLGMAKNETRAILDVIDTSQVDRLPFTIRDWRASISCAEDSDFPDRYELYAQYKDVIDDYQVTTGINNRINAVSLSKYVLKNSDESINVEATKELMSYWTYLFIQASMLSFFYGYVAIQITWDDDNKITGIKVIPYENTAPEFGAIKKQSDFGINVDNLIVIDGSIYEDSVVEVFKDRKNLGLLNKTVPYYIWKKVFGAWSQHADLFGMDARIVKTDITDTSRRNSAVNMLKGMVRAAWGVFDKEDEFETVGQGKADAYNIYEKLIEKCDQAISKILVGQTGTSDEKSYVGAAKVHQEIFNSYTEADKIFITHIVQNEWLPILEELGIIPTGLTFEFDDSTELTMLEKVQVIKDLAPYFNFTPTFIEKYIGLEVEEKTELSGGEKVFENIAKLYMNKGEDKNG